jgi:hypothetical protein
MQAAASFRDRRAVFEKSHESRKEFERKRRCRGCRVQSQNRKLHSVSRRSRSGATETSLDLTFTLTSKPAQLTPPPQSQSHYQPLRQHGTRQISLPRRQLPVSRATCQEQDYTPTSRANPLSHTRCLPRRRPRAPDTRTSRRLVWRLWHGHGIHRTQRCVTHNYPSPPSLD